MHKGHDLLLLAATALAQPPSNLFLWVQEAPAPRRPSPQPLEAGELASLLSPPGGKAAQEEALTLGAEALLQGGARWRKPEGASHTC